MESRCTILCMQDENLPIDSTVLVQLFSPIIVSQRIMFCQFDNSYTYLECENDLHIAFQEVSKRYTHDNTKNTVKLTMALFTLLSSFWASYS